MTRRISPKTTLDHLRKEAKRWLKALRAQDAEARSRLEQAIPQAPSEPALRHVQLALAREYGFSGWVELKNALASHDPLVDRFLEYACPDHHVRGGPAHSMARGAALRLLEQHPEFATASFATAIVCGNLSAVERFLRESPDLAQFAGSVNSRSDAGTVDDIEKELPPKHWTPLLFLCFTRLDLPAVNENAVAIARLLLDHGADPNAYFMAGGSQYTPMVGAIGEGEEARPAHPRRDQLARLLLERGAKPYDHQVVYNIHFNGKVLWYLRLMYEFSAKAGLQADWSDPEWHMLDMGGYGTGARWHLWIAVNHNDLELAEWCLAHRASPNAGPARSQRLPQCSLYESAARLGQMEMADLFARYGAQPVELPRADEDAFVAAAMHLDQPRITEILTAHPEYLQSSKALFQAARQNRTEVVRMLLDLGISLEVEDATQQRALHVAAAADALDVARLLVERGAEIDPLEKNWSAPPLGLAMWGNHTRMVNFLAPRSRSLWHLVFTGNVERVRELLAADPQFDRDTWEYLLFDLPDDEAKALEIAELFLSLGADPSFRRKDGTTAADAARRRGLYQAAAKLEVAGVERYEKLAGDMILAFDTGDSNALARLNRHYHQALTLDDLRAQVWRRVYAARHAGGGPGSLDQREARLLMARTAGFANWELFMDSIAKGTPAPEAPYVIDQKEARIGPRRLLTPDEWDLLIAQMNEQRITGFDANGYATDAALEKIAHLDHVTSLNLSGSREVSDEGLLHLARMPQLRSLNLNEYPGGKLTDRGLEVLRHLPELRDFEMTWQKGISDRGAANLRYCEKLERVNLMGSPTGDSVIKALRGKPALRDLSSGRLVTDAGLAMLQEFPMFRQPSESNESTRLLIDGPFSNHGLAMLANLDGLYALDLFWHVTAITTDAFEVLPRLANLGSLGCDGKLSDDRAMQFIAAIPRLRKLRAQGSIATDDGFIALSQAKTLEDFWGREAPNLTGRGFAAFSKMPSLRKLGISLKGVDDEALSLLPRFPALRELTPIDVLDDGFRHIGKCDRLERLVCMYCRDTTDAATEHVRNLKIRDYYAGKTKITDRSLEILGGMHSLEKLEFWECEHITDAGLTFLAALPNLREVEFGAVPGVTLEGTRAFPNQVRVHYSH